MIRFHSALTPLMVPAEQVSPDPRNYNNGDIDEIIASITVNGCYRPVYVARETGHIVAGHHLYAALMELGATEIPVLWLDGDDEAALRMLLGDNRIAALAKSDDGLLLDLLRQLEHTDKGLLGTGYNEDYLERLARDDYDIPDDELPEPKDLNTHARCPNCGHEWLKGSN